MHLFSRFALFLFVFVVMTDFVSPQVASASDAADAADTTSTGNNDDDQNRIWLRLYITRHGESEANLQNVIAGQQDSPLTEKGKKDAQFLGHGIWFHEVDFWRIYTSNLTRARDTLNLALEEASRINPDAKAPAVAFPPSSSSSMIVDEPRLQERSYGPREGFDRLVTSLSALQLRNTLSTMEDNYKREESDDDLWDRLRAWIRDLILEVMADDRERKNGGGGQQRLPVYNVLASAHAGIIRQTVLHLFGKEGMKKNPNAKFAKAKKDATQRLLIPNTSMTIVEFDIDTTKPKIVVPKAAKMAGAKLVAFAEMVKNNKVVLKENKTKQEQSQTGVSFDDNTHGGLVEEAATMSSEL